MADVKTINGYTVKDETARTAIENLNTVQLASSGGASGSIRFGVDSNGKYGYYKAGADTVTPFSSGEPHIPIVKAVDANWTADKDYDYAIVVGIRGNTPTIGYVGSGTMTQVAVLDGGGQYDRIYRIAPIKSGEKIINYYRMCVIA